MASAWLAMHLKVMMESLQKFTGMENAFFIEHFGLRSLENYVLRQDKNRSIEKFQFEIKTVFSILNFYRNVQLNNGSKVNLLEIQRNKTEPGQGSTRSKLRAIDTVDPCNRLDWSVFKQRYWELVIHSRSRCSITTSVTWRCNECKGFWFVFHDIWRLATIFRHFCVSIRSVTSRKIFHSADALSKS